MQIVIDIPKEMHKAFVQGSFVAKYNMYDLVGCVMNGIPLPKGHGRLIDTDEAIKTLKSLGSRDYRRERGTIQEAIKMLSYDEYTPTIIEADKED